MDEDAAQALAFTLEQEHRRFLEEQELLANDPGYLEWLIKLERENDYRCA